MTDDLELLELPRPTGERMWVPFGTGADSHDGFRSGWWGNVVWDIHHYQFFLLQDAAGTPIARVQLDWEFRIDTYPTADARRHHPILEIQFIEVHRDFRCRGAGTSMVERIQTTFPDRQLLALSEGADGFWESLGWSRHRHEEDDGSTNHFVPLYLAP